MCLGQLPKAWLKQLAVTLVRTDPQYAHPQHMKVAKHLICVWHWSGRPFEWVYPQPPLYVPVHPSSSRGKQHLRPLPKILADERSCNIVRSDTYAHSQQIKNVKTLITVWPLCGSPLEWVYSLNHHTIFQFVPWEGYTRYRELASTSIRRLTRAAVMQ